MLISIPFIVQLQIEEITRRLKMNDLCISSNPENRLNLILILIWFFRNFFSLSNIHSVS